MDVEIYAIISAIGVMAGALAYSLKMTSKTQYHVVKAFFRLDNSIQELKQTVSELKEEIRLLRKTMNNKKMYEEIKQLVKQK